MGAGAHRVEDRYRPYCDACGEKLWDLPLTLTRARLVARAHAARDRHDVRIEPWDSYALVELVTWRTVGTLDATGSDGA